MLYLIIIAAVLAIGIPVVLLRHRKPSSMSHSIGQFEKGMDALKPGEERHGS
jgi:hypothetical protein